jgi:hypothetical protein
MIGIGFLGAVDCNRSMSMADGNVRRDNIHYSVGCVQRLIAVAPASRSSTFHR